MMESLLHAQWRGKTWLAVFARMLRGGGGAGSGRGTGFDMFTRKRARGAKCLVGVACCSCVLFRQYKFN